MIDSNVWIYAFMKGNEGRASKATLLIEQTDPIILSTQIVNEVCNVLLRKHRASKENIANYIDYFYGEYSVSVLGENTLKQASELRIQNSFSFWDSLIVASAIENQCKILYSEDMQHDLKLDQLRIVNPFVENGLT